MSSIISITGNLGADPEQHKTPNGVECTTFRLADNHTWTDKDGNQGKQTSWWNAECWNGQGKAVMENLKKGDKVTVMGRPELREWTDDQGVKRIYAVIANARVEFLIARPAPNTPPNGKQNGKVAQPPIGQGGPDDTGSVPF